MTGLSESAVQRRRKAFYAAIQRDWDESMINFKEVGGTFVNADIEAAWWAWNAALDSAVIDLPDVQSATDIAYFNADVIDAIERAGLRVKS